MAMFGGGDTSMTIVVKARNEATKVFKAMEKNLETFKGRVEKMKPSFKKMATGGAASLGAIAVGVNKSVKAFQAQERAETRLTQIARQVTGATDEQVDSMKDVAAELQKVGVVGDEVVISGQSQLASFALTSDQVNVLSGSFADLLVANKGVNATQEDAITTANALGKAIGTGLLGPLQLSGVLLTDQQKALFEVANQEERVAILNEVLQDNYGGLNEAMRKTSEGGITALNNSFGDMMESIGETLVPIIESLVEKLVPVVETIARWVKENPKLTKVIIIVVAAFAALLTVVGLIGLALPAIITGFGLLFSPVTIIILAIGALIAAGVLLWKNWGKIKALGKEIWGGIKEVVGSVVDWIKEKVDAAIELWNKMKEIVSAPIKATGTFVSGVFNKAKNALSREHGGTVPGPRGLPVPIMAHGQEQIIPAGKTGQGGSNLSLVINNPVFRNNEDAMRLKQQLDKYFRPLITNHKLSL